MLSQEQIDQIKNYGKLSYENGYRDGYRHGLGLALVVVILFEGSKYFSR
jgi:hypothetical protein